VASESRRFHLAQFYAVTENDVLLSASLAIRDRAQAFLSKKQVGRARDGVGRQVDRAGVCGPMW
jgi:hypothetical protein